jgi:hypothetical protein
MVRQAYHERLSLKLPGFKLKAPFNRKNSMTIIRQDDFIQSITDAMQYISYYHPLNFIQALNIAYQEEQGCDVANINQFPNVRGAKPPIWH